MTLAAFTSPALINANLCRADAAGVITDLTQCLHGEGVVTDSLIFCDAALNHEFLAPTHVASVVAFPHARSHVVTRLAVAVGRSRTPIAWGNKGGDVRLVFLSAVPTSCSAAYFNLLASLAGLFRRPTLREQLLEASDALKMYEVLKHLDDLVSAR